MHNGLVGVRFEEYSGSSRCCRVLNPAASHFRSLCANYQPGRTLIGMSRDAQLLSTELRSPFGALLSAPQWTDHLR